MKNTLFILILIFSSCSFKNRGKAIEELENWLEQNRNVYSYCVIIPGAGCEGCILNTENLVREYYDRSDVLFVFTRIETLKLLKYKLGEEVSSSNNILFDTENCFEEVADGENNIYPVVCMIKNNKVVDWQYVSPEQKRDVIGDLKKELDSRSAYTIDLRDYLDSSKKDEIALNALLDSLEYVPLQTPDELPVDVLLSVKISEDYIYVLDKQQRLYRFNRMGIFLNLIGNKGPGPEEYLNVVDFDVDEDKGVVYLFDNYKHKIMSYQVSGNFMHSLNVPKGVINVALNKDCGFIGYRPWYASADKKNQLLLFDESLDKIKTLDVGEPYMEDVKVDIFRMARFDGLNERLVVCVPFDDVIYSFSKDKIEQYIHINQGEYLLPKEVAGNTNLYNNNLTSSYIFELNTVQARRFVYLSFFYKMEHYRVVYDMILSAFYTISVGRKPKGIINDMDGGASFWPLWFESNCVVGVISPELLDCSDEKTKVIYEKFKTMDNPVLQIGYY